MNEQELLLYSRINDFEESIEKLQGILLDLQDKCQMTNQTIPRKIKECLNIIDKLNIK